MAITGKKRELSFKTGMIWRRLSQDNKYDYIAKDREYPVVYMVNNYHLFAETTGDYPTLPKVKAEDQCSYYRDIHQSEKIRIKPDVETIATEVIHIRELVAGKYKYEIQSYVESYKKQIEAMDSIRHFFPVDLFLNLRGGQRSCFRSMMEEVNTYVKIENQKSNIEFVIPDARFTFLRDVVDKLELIEEADGQIITDVRRVKRANSVTEISITSPTSSLVNTMRILEGSLLQLLKVKYNDSIQKGE